MWPEIQQAKDENKRELKLAGADVTERIDAKGIDSNLFALESLNLLNISDTSLQTVPAEISNLINLQILLLYGNEIASVPDSIAKLDKLKVLDLSRNKLEKVPEGIAQLQNLTTINISSNQLGTFPALNNFSKLSVIDLSANKLNEFPDIYSENNHNLSEIYLKENFIGQIPHEIAQLVNLKHFSLANNQIEKIPKTLAKITKLKDFDLANNPITDKRLLKLIQQCRTKQILDYVKQHGEDQPKNVDGTPGGDSKSQGKSKKSKQPQKPKGPQYVFVVKRHSEDSVKVIFDDHVKDVRPYILCCIVQNVNLTDGNFRKFLQIQTKLHETVCMKREKSTIATHDLNKLPIDGKFLKYTAKDPEKLQIHPLGKIKKMSAQKLYDDLKAEAEALRKEKKRNVYSGIHKYLYLLENKAQFSCVEDALGNVISLPPLTNGDLTKISAESTHILVEVTSSTSMSDCRTTIEELLKAMLLSGFGKNNVIVDEESQNVLEIQQIKVTDMEGNLRQVYPSKTDLNFGENENIKVNF